MSTATKKTTAPTVSYPEWFCLNPGRENFHVDPDRDHQFLFGKGEWKDDIDARLRRSLALKEPVRLVWWGQYGIGKTHRLKFIRQRRPPWRNSKPARSCCGSSGTDWAMFRRRSSPGGWA